jgi:transcription elongation GreA/GreB family factor
VTYQIVGQDELDESLGSGRISYVSPLGQALLGKREGEDVVLRRPAGKTTYTLVKVEWK